MRGLSPRVRGNPAIQLGELDSVTTGSIPACAGEPPKSEGGSRLLSRSIPACAGEPREVPGQIRSLSKVGLSPRVRGNRSMLPQMRSLAFGSIPACAGEPIRRDHACHGSGLSPRVRGNLLRRAVLIRGSIPACAGEPPGRQMHSRPRSVYPRVCGGTLRRSRKLLLLLGLSPRVRGNPLTYLIGLSSKGSIPACAGEPNEIGLPRPVMPGLSPRVRGNRLRRTMRSHNPRSIPACAGEPHRHPRAT